MRRKCGKQSRRLCPSACPSSSHPINESSIGMSSSKLSIASLILGAACHHPLARSITRVYLVWPAHTFGSRDKAMVKWRTESCFSPVFLYSVPSKKCTVASSGARSFRIMSSR